MKADFDNGIAPRAALGVVVLQQDETLEPELRAALDDDGVALYHSRIPSDEEITPDTLKAMAIEMPRALQLLPVTRPLDVVAYACTSASTMIGQDRVAAMIRDACSMSRAFRSFISISAISAHCARVTY